MRDPRRRRGGECHPFEADDPWDRPPISPPATHLQYAYDTVSVRPRVLSGLGHAFVGPVIAARSSLARAEARHPGEEDLRQVGEALDRANMLLEAVARLAATERTPAPVDVRLDEALRAALRRVALAQALPEVRAGALPVVHADEDHLTSMLTELLGNVARHAGPTSTVVVTATTTGDEVHLTLCDDGPGLPPGFDVTAVEAFRSGSRDGAGCGLAVTATLADRNGGALAIGRPPAGGMCARLTLPAAKGR